ncbi:uncharacterized protein K489DRAFT_96000 [Dissoconium aciculare CBS 342.82]|uniref:BTB domain-containing protein n=1 Tax=Dissoconium aciculare CBS 342.82 TaxID=1314786 RepID=A0A6J3LRT1_9PEZI|nr:uncharacterized protein K489DRAFT_96000 [Dissoconium aciculare CBS 342.82]KAF1818333.1 hypothetical protein K489DRAFT_96000 [Dissoconium aciculare CBS 342.82]
MDGSYADYEVKCEDTVWRVHRAILGPRSAFFATCFENFHESTCGSVELKEVAGGAPIVEMALKYVYTLEYPRDTKCQPFTHHALLFIFADVYQIPDLSLMATAEFRKQTLRSSTKLSLKDIFQSTRILYTLCAGHHLIHRICAIIFSSVVKKVYARGSKELVEHLQGLLESMPRISAQLCKTLAMAPQGGGSEPIASHASECWEEEPMAKHILQSKHELR